MIITARNLSKIYRGTTAVSDVSFQVPKGICFGLLGPNGAGKSTIIKMLYGAISRSGGELSVLGMDPKTDYRALRRRVGVVTQEDSLDEEMSVRENMLLFAGFYGLEKKSAEKRVGELLEFLTLSHKSDERIQALSGGMKRRLVFVRSLIPSPELLILDEPTTGLDPAVRHLLWERIESLKAAGTTVLLTTHYMEEAEHLCDEIVILDQGTIKRVGSPRRLIEEQKMGYVALLDRKSSISRLEEPTLEALTFKINELGVTPTVIRPANLEDVFIKLTGKGLSDHA